MAWLIVSLSWTRLWKIVICKPGRGLSSNTRSTGTLIFDSVSRTLRSKCVLLMLPSLCYFIIAAKLTNILQYIAWLSAMGLWSGLHLISSARQSSLLDPHIQKTLWFFFHIVTTLSIRYIKFIRKHKFAIFIFYLLAGSLQGKAWLIMILDYMGALRLSRSDLFVFIFRSSLSQV